MKRFRAFDALRRFFESILLVLLGVILILCFDVRLTFAWDGFVRYSNVTWIYLHSICDRCSCIYNTRWRPRFVHVFPVNRA